MTRVVVVVPGFMGSTLAWRGRTIWPAALPDFVFGYPHLEQLLEPDVQVTGLLERYAIAPFYEVLLEDLVRAGFVAGATLWTVPYDWRKGHAHAAEALARTLEAVVAAVPDAAVTVIGHSMGGTATRYYLETGDFDGRPGYTAVREVLFLAAPFRGTVNIVSGLMGQVGLLWLSAAQVYRFASDPRYPAAYELLPGPGEPWTWRSGGWGTVDLYGDVGLAAGLGLVRHNLNAALAYHEKVAEGRRPPGVRYFCFAGTRHRTATALEVGPGPKGATIKGENAGDGAIPTWSTSLPGVQVLPVGGEHWTLYKDPLVRRGLLRLLGAHDAAANVDDGVQISLPTRAMAGGHRITANVRLPGPEHAPGELRFEAFEDGRFVATGSSVPVADAGGGHGQLAVALTAPVAVGVYRVAYYRAGETTPAGTDTLVVRAEG